MDKDNLKQNLQSILTPPVQLALILLFTFFFPVFSIPILIYRIINEKNNKLQILYLICVSLIIGYLAYHTVPAITDDLCRHYENMAVLKSIPIYKIFNASYSGVYLNTLIMYLISLTGKFGLYPALYVTIGYTFIFLMIYKFKTESKCSNRDFILITLFVFFTINCRDFISGLRNYFTFILCAFLIIQRYYNKISPKTCYIGIIILSLIHTSALLILILVVFNDITKDWKYRKYINGLIIFFIPIFIVCFKIFEHVLPEVAHTVFFTKVYGYFTTLNFYNMNVYIFYIGVLILALLCHFITKKHSTRINKGFSSFIDLYIVFVIAISPLMLLLTRFMFLLVPLLGCMLCETIKNTKYQKTSRTIILFFICGGILMFLASLRAYPWRFDIPHILFWWIR